MDFVIRRHMLLKEERKWLILCAGGWEVTLLLWLAAEIDARRTEINGERMWYQRAFHPYMNFELNKYSLTSGISFIHKEILDQI